MTRDSRLVDGCRKSLRVWGRSHLVLLLVPPLGRCLWRQGSCQTRKRPCDGGRVSGAARFPPNAMKSLPQDTAGVSKGLKIAKKTKKKDKKVSEPRFPRSVWTTQEVRVHVGGECAHPSGRPQLIATAAGWAVVAAPLAALPSRTWGWEVDGRRSTDSRSMPAPARLRGSLLPIPVIGSIARGDQRLNCSMHGFIESRTVQFSR